MSGVTILWINLAVVFVLALMARYFSVPVIDGIGRPMNISPNKLLCMLAAASLIIVSGLRLNIGDTYFYRHAYEVGEFSWDRIAGQPDVGFYILQLLLKTVSQDPQILIFVMGLMTNALIVTVLYNYSRFLEISLYVYITSGAFIVSMNGMRQYLAAAIVFAATPFLLKGKWAKYFAVVLFASLFHQSALVLIPIYFLVRKKAWTGTTAVLLTVAVAVVAAFNQFTEVLFAAIGDTQYGHYETFEEGGAHVLRVFVSAAPLFIAYIGRERLRELFPRSDVIVNLSLMGTVLMLIATQNWIFARLSIYFDLYQLILVGWIVALFRKKDQRLVYFAIGIAYLLFFYYEQVITLGLEYRSHYLVW